MKKWPTPQKTFYFRRVDAVGVNQSRKINKCNTIKGTISKYLLTQTKKQNKEAPKRKATTAIKATKLLTLPAPASSCWTPLWSCYLHPPQVSEVSPERHQSQAGVVEEGSAKSEWKKVCHLKYCPSQNWATQKNKFFIII